MSGYVYFVYYYLHIIFLDVDGISVDINPLINDWLSVAGTPCDYHNWIGLAWAYVIVYILVQSLMRPQFLCKLYFSALLHSRKRGDWGFLSMFHSSNLFHSSLNVPFPSEESHNHTVQGSDSEMLKVSQCLLLLQFNEKEGDRSGWRLHPDLILPDLMMMMVL